jgi:hypothetical protein
MPRSAPRISYRLLDALERLDDGKLGFGELTRRVGAEAVRLGLPRPSYEQVRSIAVRRRTVGAARPRTAEVLLEVATRARPPEALLDHLTDGGLSK